jgi:hypothetical protein
LEDSYEASGWLRDYPLGNEPRCYLATGGTAGLMNLLYVGDITARPELDEAYYRTLFRGGESFTAREIKCLARGDARCEFVAERQRR